MNKLYTVFLSLMMVGTMSAQVDVTLEVDMNNQTVDDMLGVHIAGNFGATNPSYTEWNPGNNPDPIVLTDDDLDGVYSVTLQLVPGTYEFKYVNGNDWPMAEDVPNACRYNPTGDANRYLTIGQEAITYRVCYSECADCGMEAVRFRVDMTQYPNPIPPVGVHVAGTFQLPQVFTPDQNPMEDYDEDGIWDLLFTYNPGDYEEIPTSFEYKYIVGNQWFNPSENAITSDCGTQDGGNRVVELTSPSTITPNFCYDSCNLCVAASNITFQVDMSNIDSPDGAYIAGVFQGWSGNGSPMNDIGGGLYEMVFPLQPGVYEYKFLNGPNGWENVPSECAFNQNRQILVEEGIDQIITYCFEQCGDQCVVDPDPEDITFRVDMSNVDMISADGIYVMGVFTEPLWQAGAIVMSDADNDMIYEATVTVSGSAEFQYKYTNGDPYPDGSIDGAVEEIGDFETLGCGVPNGIGGFNRIYTRDGSGAVLDIVCYNFCTALCEVSVNEIEERIRFTAYPNPADEDINVTFEDIATVQSIQLMNQLGKELIFISGNNISADCNMDISHLPSGVYTLRVNTSQGDVAKLIIKK